MTKEKQGKQLQLLNQEPGAIEGVSCSLDGEGYCITCSDEAVQVRVMSVNEENGLALVALDEVEEEIDVTLIDHIAPGDVLLVHGGVAIGHVDEASNV